MKRKSFEEILSLLLFIILIYAGIIKLINHRTTLFEWSISDQFRPFASFISLTLPIIEIATGFALFANKTRLIGLMLSTILFTTYIIAMHTLKFYVPNIRGGALSHGGFNQYLFINILLLILSVLTSIILLRNRKVVSDR